MGVVLTGTYVALYAAIATSAAALTGLLFVVMTVAESRTPSSLAGALQEIRASAALLSFTNALAVSLFSLVPGTHVGYPAVVVGVIGVFFSGAAMRSILASDSTQHWRERHVTLTVFLLVVFAVELGWGIDLLLHPHSTTSLDIISYVLVGSLIIGIARAWELVGGRETGIIASLTLLVGHHLRAQDSVDRRAPGPTDREGTGEAERLGRESDKNQ